ncbi:hypothetical protein CLOM_g14174 [Closterium sp. NIES-68]|nr:hypothetical protein CLOM_g14174 [Closterium sp. NIES-68]
MGAAGDGRSVEGGDFESLLGHGAAAGPPGAGACEETLIEKMEIAPPRITVGSHPARPVSSDPRDADPPVFEWRAEGHGFLISRGFNHTAVDIRVGGSRMQANLTNQRHWDPSHPGAGPEGWAASLSQLIPGGGASCPVAGSSIAWDRLPPTVSQTNPRGWRWRGWGGRTRRRTGGRTFLQAMCGRRACRLTTAYSWWQRGRFFRVASLPSPLILTLGLRTPHLALDLRSIDPLTSFSPPIIHACSGTLTLAAQTTNAALRLRVRAPPASFSGAVWMPRGDGDWDATGRESFSAVMEIEVDVWGEGTGEGGGVLKRLGTYFWGGVSRWVGRGTGVGTDASGRRKVYRYTVCSAALEFAGEYECLQGEY